MDARRLFITSIMGLLVFGVGWMVQAAWLVESPDSEPDAAERGRAALIGESFLSPAWNEEAFRDAGQLWQEGSPDANQMPFEYQEAFNQRYGLHPAPYPNNGLPMGLRLASRQPNSPHQVDRGLQLDCMICHGGSIGGQSYIGLGNTQLDLESLAIDLTRADGQPRPIAGFTVNTTRGTIAAGQMSALLLNFRNRDFSQRRFPLLLPASYPETDVPAWWLLKKKQTMYYDGRTDADSVRSIMQFLMGEHDLDTFKELEPTFDDIHAYLKSLEPPKYPFAIDEGKAETGRAIFENQCASCHGTYGDEWTYPNAIVDLDLIGTDPARALAPSDAIVAHYNATWLGERLPADMEMHGYQAPPLDGIWATAPYLHNGSVPTLYHLLKSSARPDRFHRPPSTDFEHYDTDKVGWRFEVVEEGVEDSLPQREARFIYDSSRFGLGNQGHTFGDRLTEEERMAVIEYLKTL